MCQILSKRIHEKSVIGYRVYDIRKLSCYGSNEILPLNKRVLKNTDEPFHAFSSLKSLKIWKRDYRRGMAVYIFKCKLEGNLQRGIWSGDGKVRTVTGDYCTLLEEIQIIEPIVFLGEIRYRNYIEKNFKGIIRDNIVNNILSLDYSISRKTKKSEFLVQAFTWSTSKEGYDYWNALYTTYQSQGE